MFMQGILDGGLVGIGAWEKPAAPPKAKMVKNPQDPENFNIQK
jgi:hypothetical protein